MIETKDQTLAPVENRLTVPLIDKTIKNTRNMPSIIFVENVEEYIERYGYELVIEEINVYYR